MSVMSRLLPWNSNRAIAHAQLRQNFLDLRVLLRVIGIGYVRDMQEQRSFLHLFKRRAERGN